MSTTETRPAVITYVTLLYPGAFFPEESSRQVASRDPEAVAREADPGVFAFYFYDVAVTTAVVDGQERKMASAGFSQSGRYYIDGESMTAAELLQWSATAGGDHRILRSNMEANGWERMVRCRTGNFQPLLDGDSVVSSGTGDG